MHLGSCGGLRPLFPYHQDISRKNLARLLASYFSQRGLVAVAVFAAIVVISMTAIQPLLIQSAIDRSIGGGRGQRLLLPMAGAPVSASLVKALGVLVRKRLAMTASIGTEARLRGELYEHLQSLDVSYHERTPTGQLMSRASSDLQAIRDFLSLIPISIGMFLLLGAVAAILISKMPRWRRSRWPGSRSWRYSGHGSPAACIRSFGTRRPANRTAQPLRIALVGGGAGGEHRYAGKMDPVRGFTQADRQVGWPHQCLSRFGSLWPPFPRGGRETNGRSRRYVQTSEKEERFGDRDFVSVIVLGGLAERVEPVIEAQVRESS